MKIHPTISLLVIDNHQELNPLLAYLNNIQPIELCVKEQLPNNLSSYDVVVVNRLGEQTETEFTTLESYVQTGGALLGLTGLSNAPLPTWTGVKPADVGPEVELRILFTDQSTALRTRLPDAFYVSGRFHNLQIANDDTQTILYADWRYTHQAVLTERPYGNGLAAVSTLQAFANPRLQQVLYRYIRHLADQPNAGQTLGVGLLGYAPSVGQLHGQGAEATAGLELRAACDLNPERLKQAEVDFNGQIRTYDTSAALAADPDIDVVIIATPPHTHAKLSIAMLEAGKHVICEKPLAFNRAETAAMINAAKRNERHLSCHQNRRWDVDYLAIKQAVTDGLIGDLFYMELFVGSFNHPCGFWHSHDQVSGGTTYDWGAHYLDWVVGLMDDPVTEVIGTRQNRLWHDVTNADQERIQVRFANGQEIDFIHSDIAAVRKPKWYVLGTEGGIIGRWRDITEYQIDPVLYFERHDIPPTEMPPELILHKVHHSGRTVEQKIDLPPRIPYAFHRNLADHLLTGEPLTVPVEQSARVVAILEAAARSAEKGGTVEKLDL